MHEANLNDLKLSIRKNNKVRVKSSFLLFFLRSGEEYIIEDEPVSR